MNLKESLKKKRFVVTSEVQVPLGDEEPEAVVENLSRLKGRVDGVSISEIELEGVVSDTIKTCGLLKDNNLNAIYQTTTR
ncbi:MAG: methylenetetrahydrofolate reductase, partial [Desulfobacula sp.]|nr:methylenetetrahydrofolate reductase [Desulfobacula sp.]